MKNVVTKLLTICFCCLLSTSFALAQSAPPNGSSGSSQAQSQSSNPTKAKKHKKHKKPVKKPENSNGKSPANSVCLSCIG
jgi:hypothetical protein